MNDLTLVQFSYNTSVQLGSLYLAYGLERAGIQFDLKVFPLHKRGKFYPGLSLSVDELYSFLAKSKRILAVGCWSDMLPFLVVALERIKRTFPNKIIILGGAGPTADAEEILKKFEHIDYVLKGCGIKTLPELIKKILWNDTLLFDIEGLVHRSHRKVVSNDYRGYQFNIPALPAYHRIKNIKSCRVFRIFTSAGCPYRCTFCNARDLLPPKLVYRDLLQIIEEIKVIEKLKEGEPYKIDFVDEGFIVNKERVMEFCELLMLKKFKFTWLCYGRIDRMDEELLKMMAASGCNTIFYGVESGSNAVLKKIKKGFTIEKAVDALKLSKKYIKAVIASFIYLYPFESVSDFNETLFFANYLKSAGIKIHLQPLIPVRNSEIYSEFGGRLTISDRMVTASHERISAMPRECAKLIKCYPEIFYYYYYYHSPVFNVAIQKRRLIHSIMHP